MKFNKKVVVGIDEAGRGPLAGPVAVGICIYLSHKQSVFSGVKDSKKLSPAKREKWFEVMKKEKKNGNINFVVTYSSQKLIDTMGLTFAIRRALASGLKKLKVNSNSSKIFLDGGLYAPKRFKFQKTIIKGDEKIPVISLASIAAKVLRDKRMIRYSKKYPEYGFDIHKGYGTEFHRKMISKYRPSKIHRKSFLKLT